MNYVLAIPAAVCSGLVAYCTLDRDLADKIKILHFMGTSGEKERKLSGRWVMLLSIVVGALCYGAAVMIFFHTEEILNRIKMLIALICVAGAACNDYREERIPNIFPLAMAVSGLVCLTVGYVISQNGARSYIASSLIATVLVASCMSVAALLTKNGIGIGDIKLLSALALLGGMYAVGGTLFFGMLICFLAAIILLISRKKTIKESLPFGPFVFIGYVMSIFASIY